MAVKSSRTTRSNANGSVCKRSGRLSSGPTVAVSTAILNRSGRWSSAVAGMLVGAAVGAVLVERCGLGRPMLINTALVAAVALGCRDHG
ncbi:hypothetical protein [Kitasatospora sp. NPDC004272]